MKKIIGFIAIILCGLFLIGCTNPDTPVYQGVSLDVKNIVKPKMLRETNDDLPNLGVTSDAKYFVNKNELVKVRIELSNPKDYEILSLTINDKKYQSYEFAKGSNGILILIEMQAPALAGEHTYTVDKIKYVDDTTIKLVDMSKAPKTIKFGVKYSLLPEVSFANQKHNYDSYEADLSINDPEKLLNVGVGKIYVLDHENQIIYKGDITNKINLKDLTPGIKYTVLVSLSMDLLDGNGSKTFVLAKDRFTTPSAIDFFVTGVTESSVEYGYFIIEESAQILSLKLFGEDFEKDIDFTDFNTQITGLKKDKNYYFIFKYQFNGKIYEYRRSFITKENTVYEITNINIKVKEMSVEYSAGVSTLNGILKYMTYLYLDGVYVAENQDTMGIFEHLYADREYELEFFVVFDSPDLNGNTECSKRQKFRTKKVEEPFLEPVNLRLDNGRLTGDIEFTNPLSQPLIQSVDLYKNDELISTNTRIDFFNITNLNDYVIKINITFDFRNGSGRKAKTFIIENGSEYRVEVNNFTVNYPDSILGLGEILEVSMDLSAKDQVKCEFISINGKEYKIKKQTGNTIYFDMINDGSLGGLTSFNIDYFVLNINNEIKTINNIGGKKQNVDIKGDLLDLKLILVDENLKPVEYLSKSGIVNILLKFNNNSSYEIVEVLLKKNQLNDLIKVSDNEYLLKYDLISSEGISISGLTIKKDDFTETISLKAPLFIYVSILQEGMINHIKEPGDFAYLGRYNVLDNDIDFAGYDLYKEGRKHNVLIGTLDGNGHTISNLNINLNHKEEGILNVGLFEYIRGEVKNLNIKNFNYKITITTKEFLETNIGFLGGQANGNLKINNVHVSSDSRIEASSVKWSPMAAGLIGDALYTVEINNSSNEGTIISPKAAGLIGRVGGDLIITDSYNKGLIGIDNYDKIKENNLACGLAVAAINTIIQRSYNSGLIIADKSCGFIENASSAKIEESYNSADIYGNIVAVGIIDRVKKLYIINSYNIGDITSIHYTSGIAGDDCKDVFMMNVYNSGLISSKSYGYGFICSQIYEDYDLIFLNIINLGSFNIMYDFTKYYSIHSEVKSNLSKIILRNAYTLLEENKQIEIQGKTVKLQQINKSFFKDKLNFSEDVWNLENINPIEGLYPTLKNIK